MPHSIRRRYVAIVIVGALHVLIVEIFVYAPPSRERPPKDDAVWSTLFLIPREVTRQPPPQIKPQSAVPRSLPRLQTPAAEPDSPMTMAPNPAATGSSVDWMSELSSVATDVAKVRGAQSGSSKATPDQSGSWWAPPVHKAGEQYRLSTGELVVWVSDRCFLVSELPALGTPNSAAHMGLTHTQCVSDPGPRADLFKDLPAYGKYHPDP